METVLQAINKYFVSLSKEDAHQTTEIVNLVVGAILKEMAAENPLFKALFKKLYYGGSFYENLKICTPEEYDIDLLLRLPKQMKPVLKTSDIPGFVCVQLLNVDGFLAQDYTAPVFRDLPMLLDDDYYLSGQYVLEWMESMMKEILPFGWDEYGVHFSREGPALTLHIVGGGREVKVDLVASFVFGEEMWPEKGFRPNPVRSKPEFSIVPKHPNSSRNYSTSRYWRPSFQEQERCLIKDKMFLKPTLRLLKKMRDNLGHNCIASYYLKTVVLHLVDREDNNFWGKSLTWVFVKVLEEYKKFIAKKSIPYYWNKEDNLLKEVDQNTLEAICHELTSILNKVQDYYVNNTEKDALGITRYLLTAEEYDSIFYDVMVCTAVNKLSEEECFNLYEKSHDPPREYNTRPPPSCCSIISFIIVLVFICTFYTTGGK